MPGVGRGKSGRSNSKLRAGSSELDALPKHVTQHVDPDTKETYYHDSHSRTFDDVGACFDDAVGSWG